MGSFQHSVDSRFPGAIDEGGFVRRTYLALTEHGFTDENAIACVGVCRDELCRSLVWTVRDRWGEAFNFSSLGGMLTLGTAGFRAAHYHAPIVDGRERYVYVVMPHIGVGADGALGTCLRAGRHGSSVACGALTSLLGELNQGALDLDIDPDNIEYSVLKRLVAARIRPGDVADIAELTISMSTLIVEELERMIALTVDVAIADYAVLTGVQIHRPVEGSMVWVNQLYARVNGARRSIRM
jgi:Limiting CO2-inducible proteins B/C beta carbonyic anhydrases